MSPRHFVSYIVGFALVVVAVSTIVQAQTFISNETLVSTTFVVNKKDATAKCNKTGCRAETAVLTGIPVTCPVGIDQTCTFHIFMDAKTAITFHCGQSGCLGPGPAGFYQFLVDGAAPTPGPTDADGDYLFASNVEANSNDDGNYHLASRQSYPVSVVAAVVNHVSSSHKINVNIICLDINQSGGCEVTARWSTMRIDVFEP